MAPLVPDFRAWTLPKGRAESGGFHVRERQGLALGKVPRLPCSGCPRVGRQAGSPREAGLRNPRCQLEQGRAVSTGGGLVGRTSWRLRGWMGGRQRARPRALAGRGGTLRWGWGRKCNLGEMLLVWELVDGRVPGDFQGELSRTLRGPRLRAERRGWRRERRDSRGGGGVRSVGRRPRRTGRAQHLEPPEGGRGVPGAAEPTALGGGIASGSLAPPRGWGAPLRGSGYCKRRRGKQPLVRMRL